MNSVRERLELELRVVYHPDAYGECFSVPAGLLVCLPLFSFCFVSALSLFCLSSSFTHCTLHFRLHRSFVSNGCAVAYLVPLCATQIDHT